MESKDKGILLNNNNNDYLARWEWKSNKDPWNFNEPAKWTAYTNEKSNIIKEACLKEQAEVEIGEYIIKIEKRLQINKKD